ncbi:MAG TPA: hypothetical protein VMV49_12550 [Candidatus Deferrimicrobium sp.]|nr:hypothetical protein [Candidatus Deferrimicrobium sp.]
MPQIIEISEAQEGQIRAELLDGGISPQGDLLNIIENIAYSDPVYARKRIRLWPGRAKGKLILTSKENGLLMLGKELIAFLVIVVYYYSIKMALDAWS